MGRYQERRRYRPRGIRPRELPRRRRPRPAHGQSRARDHHRDLTPGQGAIQVRLRGEHGQVPSRIPPIQAQVRRLLRRRRWTPRDPRVRGPARVGRRPARRPTPALLQLGYEGGVGEGRGRGEDERGRALRGALRQGFAGGVGGKTKLGPRRRPTLRYLCTVRSMHATPERGSYMSATYGGPRM